MTTPKNNENITKFEKFFSTNYKDELFEILKNYPTKRSINIDYNKYYGKDANPKTLIEFIKRFG